VRILKTVTRVLAVVGKELVELVRRPGAILSLILGPFLIMAIFGVGYSGYRRPLSTIIVIPPESGLPTDAASYSEISGSGLELVEVTSDEAAADARLRDQLVDVVIVAPADVEQRFRSGEKSLIDVRVNVVDPVEQTYTIFLTRSLEREVNRIVIERIAKEGQTYALGAGAEEAAAIPPEIVAAPTRAVVENIAPAKPGVVQFFGTAVLALILQHMAATLIALSVVRERTTGMFELFRISPITTIEVIVAKLVAFGILCAAIALLTLVLLVSGFGVPMLGDPALLAGIVALLILASLGLGLVIAGLSDSERQAVQLSLILLLASVFFSGFVLAIEEFSEPVRSFTSVLPVTHGIRLIGEVMLRGSVQSLWQVAVLGGLVVAFCGTSWVLLRRAMRSA
jgi:ABC-2 type transport system permease protein